MGDYEVYGSPIFVDYNHSYKSLQQRKIEELSKRIHELETKEKVELPKRYIINKNATILFWKNGKKTIVKRAEDDEFNARLGFLTAFFQHYCGMSRNKANKFLAKLQVEEEKTNGK